MCCFPLNSSVDIGSFGIGSECILKKEMLFVSIGEPAFSICVYLLTGLFLTRNQVWQGCSAIISLHFHTNPIGVTEPRSTNQHL